MSQQPIQVEPTKTAKASKPKAKTAKGLDADDAIKYMVKYATKPEKRGKIGKQEKARRDLEERRLQQKRPEIVDEPVHVRPVIDQEQVPKRRRIVPELSSDEDYSSEDFVLEEPEEQQFTKENTMQYFTSEGDQLFGYTGPAAGTAADAARLETITALLFGGLTEPNKQLMTCFITGKHSALVREGMLYHEMLSIRQSFSLPTKNFTKEKVKAEVDVHVFKYLFLDGAALRGVANMEQILGVEVSGFPQFVEMFTDGFYAQLGRAVSEKRSTVKKQLKKTTDEMKIATLSQKMFQSRAEEAQVHAFHMYKYSLEKELSKNFFKTE